MGSPDVTQPDMTGCNVVSVTFKTSYPNNETLS